ncbi:MAG: type I secretion system permease/ATPase [Amphritea sp.]|nr:type I secretion system permease/ATPase [Amphritea sp.]
MENIAFAETSPVDAGDQRHGETASLLGAFYIYGQMAQIFESAGEADLFLASIKTIEPDAALQKIAAEFDVKIAIRQCAVPQLVKRGLPAIVQGSDSRWFILAQQTDGQYLIQRPEEEQPELLSENDFLAIYSGKSLRIKGNSQASDLLKKFDVRWFIPEIARYKGLAPELLTASAVLQLFALVSPLFFQVVMDKVLVHQAVSTLDVLVTVLVAVAVFEILLQVLRQYMASRTASRIDARLGSKLYRHLVDLPLSYFKSRSVGVTVMRVNELNSIREFITGAANTLVIDLGFTFIFFAVMYYYSPLLTLIVAVSVPCYMAVSYFITAPLQARIEELSRDSSVNNAFLTESLTGIETVKALALEPGMIRRWEYQTRDFVHSNFKVQRLMQMSEGLIQIIQKVTMVLILWIGAQMVIALELSIGQLIAFNMMANHVSQPIIRLTQLWREFVQARVSVKLLGDVLNTVPEISDKHAAVPADVRGAVSLKDITFRYSPEHPPVFENLNMSIPAGHMVAFVGRSGSGKSTITRLIQKLYIPESGQVLLDGIDIATLNPVELRQAMSIVLQENFLFNRSVKDNIAIMSPSAPLADVVDAAKKAGAHEFILELKDGYDTILSEGGMSLSGGQRQRIAIARSLMSLPRVLIFDEATSALDDHSQAVIKNNMGMIRENRTVIMIAHRLSTVRDCDCIYVLDKGQIVEAGSHEELINRPDGAYRQLWQLQCSELSYEALNKDNLTGGTHEAGA